MTEKITIDLGDIPARPTAFEALEKIGRMTVKMQEQDTHTYRIQKQTRRENTAHRAGEPLPLARKHHCQYS